MKTPVNGATLKQHLTYSWWKYVLVAAFAIFGVNLYYSVTTYRPPENKKVDLYIYGLGNEPALESYLTNVRLTQMPDMEQMEALVMATDSTYGPVQLTTYIAAGEGDVYMLPRNEYISLAAEGAFIPLENDEELMAIFNDAGISLQSGWRRESESGETHLYGIPISKLPGLDAYVYVENGFISGLVTSGNEENVRRFIRILCRDMLKAPEATAVPEGEATAVPENTAEQAEATAVPENTAEPKATAIPEETAQP